MPLLANFLGGSDGTALLFVAGMLILAFFAVRMRSVALTRQQGRKPGNPAPPVPSAVRPEQVRAMAAELGDLLSEVHNTARRLAAQIDNRTVALETLLAEADEKIHQLQTLRQQLAAPAPSLHVPPADPRQGRIYDLADRGHSPREIAQQLSLPAGEVELILNLR